MRLLLDTHSLLWFLQNDNFLSRKAYEAIQSDENRSLVSMASLWEIAIKVSIGKLRIETPFEEIRHVIIKSGFGIYEIEFEHTVAVSRLPLFHRDPFDRMLIAQTKIGDMAIVSNEAVFDKYGVNRIW